MGITSTAHANMHPDNPLDQRTIEVYRHAMRALRQAGVPFLIGGAYAFVRYTGIERHTKDFDIFIKPGDLDVALEVLARAGFRTEIWASVWLAKAIEDSLPDTFIDVIYGSGNGIATVDDEWFAHAVPDTVLGMDVQLIPAEEMIWSKAFVQERERYDGADVLHIFLRCSDSLNWPRLVSRFGAHWRLLYSLLVLYGFAYPYDRDLIPADVLQAMSTRLQQEAVLPPGGKVCNGTLLSNMQYLPDVDCWSYADGRLAQGFMTPLEVRTLTDKLARNNRLPTCQ
jgi:hypothetical protein